MDDAIKYGAILENHYYSTNGAAIKYQTRNICSDATAKMLEELAKILFPDDEIEIYVIPAQDGCHQDSFWVKNKDNIKVGIIVAIAGAIFIIPGQVSQILTDISTRKLNESQIQLNQSQEELTQLQTQQLRQELSKKFPQNNITEEQYKKVVESREIKINKNKHFEQLKKDKDIKKEKIVIKQNNRILSEKTIESINFSEYIEPLQQSTITKTVEKIHHLSVIRSVNNEEYRDLMWIFEDIHGSDKFGAHMCDEDFYNIHLGNPIGMKTIIAKVKYTFKEDQDGILSKKNTEIILVYQYNGIDRCSIPEGEGITPAPLEIGKTNKEELKNVEKVSKKEVVKETNQIPLFTIM